MAKYPLLYTALILWLNVNLLAQSKPQVIQSTVEKVTVFTQGAQVTRKANVSLAKGKSELVFSGISPNIDQQSIQVGATGNFTILSVSHQTNYLNEQKKREETSGLEHQKTSLLHKLKVEKSTLTVYKNEESILTKNQSIGGSQSGVKTTDLKEVVDFQRARLSEVLLKQIDIETTIQKLDSTIHKIDQQLLALHQTSNRATSEILVTVLAKEALTTTFELSYLVKDAAWFVHYDLRVKDIESPIDLVFKANILQSSGEDWKDVRLSMSSGNPSENGIAPSLQPWYLGFGYPQNDLSNLLQGKAAGVAIRGKVREVKGKVVEKGTGQPLIGVSVIIQGTTIGTVTDINGDYTLQLPEGAQNLVFSFVGFASQEIPITTNTIQVELAADQLLLEEVVVTGYAGELRKEKLKGKDSGSIPLATKEVNQATTLTFDIETPYTVLSNGKVHTVDVKNQIIPAQYEYFAIPKLDKAAYLTAKIVDWQALNLLEGEVNLFFEGAFLGKSILALRNAGDTLNISLGKDKGIVVERKRLNEFSSKQFLSNYKTETRAYEISVRNNKAQSIRMVLQDQLPISTNKEMSIEVPDYPDATLNKDTKILTWVYELLPRKEKKHLLKYSVKYPKDQIIVLE